MAWEALARAEPPGNLVGGLAASTPAAEYSCIDTQIRHVYMYIYALHIDSISNYVYKYVCIGSSACCEHAIMEPMGSGRDPKNPKIE